MSEWKEYKLDDFADINPTEIVPKGFSAKKIPMELIQPFTKRIPGYSVEEYKGGVKFRNGDTLMARITPSLENGKTSFVDILEDNEIGFGSTEFIVFREKDNISDKHFLYYLATSPIIRHTAIKSMTGSSGRQRVQTDVVKNHSFEAPDLTEQRAIASVLSSLDDKIDLLHRQNQTLEQLAETLFREWFVEQAEEDWEIKKLLDVVDISIGRTPPRKEFHWFSTNSNDVKWISIKDLGKAGIYVFDTAEYLTTEAVEKFRMPIIPKNTVVLSFKMTVGRVAITSEDMLSNEAIAHFKFNDQTIFSKEYLYLYLKTFRYENLGSTSSIVTSINSRMIKEMEIIIPDTKTMDFFRSKTENMFLKIKENQKQIQTLTQLRDTLLPKLMSGEIRVKN